MYYVSIVESAKWEGEYGARDATREETDWQRKLMPSEVRNCDAALPPTLLILQKSTVTYSDVYCNT